MYSHVRSYYCYVPGARAAQNFENAKIIKTYRKLSVALVVAAGYYGGTASGEIKIGRKKNKRYYNNAIELNTKLRWNRIVVSFSNVDSRFVRTP